MRLVYIALAWAAGIGIANSGIPITLTTWLLLAAGMIPVCFAVWRAPGYRMAAVMTAAFAFGGLRMAIMPQTSALAAYNNLGGLTIEGLVTAAPDIRDDFILLRVSAESVFFASRTTATEGLVMVRAPRLSGETVRYGDRISATGRLITPAEYDTFSYADYLARSGVFSIMRDASIEVLSSGHGSAIFTAISDLRARCRDLINQYLPEPSAGLLNGILLGDESQISPGLAEDFSAAGAAHIVAISGFNMVIVSGVMTRTLSLARVRPRPAMLIGLLVIGVYTVFVGANAAVVRAAIMAGLLVVAEALKRKTYLPASLAFVALMMSILNPTVLYDLSFQLSFVATLGLALFADPLQQRFSALMLRLFPEPFAVTVSGFLGEPLIVTTAALITTTPLIILYFNRFSLAVLPVNLLVVPVQTALFLVGIFAVVTAFFAPIIAQVAFWFCLALLSWTIGVVRMFASLPFAQMEVSVDSRLVFVFFVCLMGGAMMVATQPGWWSRFSLVLRRRAVLAGVFIATLITASLVLAVSASRPDGLLHVFFLDVGHSDAVLIQTPGGAHMLVNGGRFPSRLLTAIGDRLPFNDQEIEVVAITQPDEFHFTALPSVLSRYETGLVLINGWEKSHSPANKSGNSLSSVGQPNLGEAFARLQVALADRMVIPVSAGYSLTIDDGIYIEILHPQTPPQLGEAYDDKAMVLRVTYNQISFLITGGISTEGQMQLLESGYYPLATILQLPQNATTRSLATAFLNAVQPSTVVVAIDPANLRGDPDVDVLAMLDDTPLFRTDQGGTVHLWTDGKDLWAVSER